MIFYFDNFLTNSTLSTTYKGLDIIRRTNTIYKKTDKKNICAYSLYSFSKIKFKCSLINLKTEKKKDFNFIKNICKKNFQNKVIINNWRSESYKSFKYSLDIIKKYKKNKWVFVMGNTDHPLIAADVNSIYKSIEFANKFLNKSDYVSIMCSHQVEYLNITNKNLVMPNIIDFPYKKIYENKSFIVLKLIHGAAHTLSTQIMSVRMLEKLIVSTNFDEKKIFRTDLMNGSTLKGHIMIVPKEKICDHYDGYSHMKLFGCYLPLNKYPPLFMPKKFFREKFNIYYGFDNIKKDGVNINPLIKKFSFENAKDGTDLKIELSKIPYFWKSRIKNIIKNKNISEKKLISNAKYIEKEISNPYEEKNILIIKLYIIYLKFRKKGYKKKIISNIKILFGKLHYFLCNGLKLP